MASIYDWSTTEANNATADSGINWQEGQLPSTVNNSARYMMRRGKELLNDLGAIATAGGTANAITVTASSPFSAYVKGIRLLFKASATNTGNATLNVNSVGAKNIVYLDAGSELPIAAGFIVSGGLYEVVYDTALAGGSGAWVLMKPPLVSSPGNQGYLYGLTLSNNATDTTNDIDIATGVAAADTSPYYLMQLTSGITKRLDAAWAVGSGNGGLDTGAIADTTYHVFLIQRSDTGVVDALFSASATAPTMPANYDRKRRIGSIIRESGAIVAFRQIGDSFFRTSVTSRSSTAAFASALLAIGIPSGIVVQPIAELLCVMGTAGNIQTFVGNASGAVSVVMGVAAAGQMHAAYLYGGVYSNTASQVQFAVAIVSGTLTTNTFVTRGWIDTRGKP